MGFSGHSMWERIALVKRSVSIPIIGNGDVRTPQDAAEMYAQTGCDGIMIGRAAMGNPWLFGQIKDALAGNPVTPVSTEQRVRMALEHLRLFREKWGEERAAAEMKKQIAWYGKGVPGVGAMRGRIFQARTTVELEKICARLASDDQKVYLNIG
jgi:tRNA-dihydrouridine synthase